MSSSSLAITKRRIASVNSTIKITSAMKVVATAKLKTYKAKLGSSLAYSKELKKVLSKVLMCMEKDDPDNINEFSVGERKLILLVTSTLGLCGGYNSSIYKTLTSVYQEGDEILVIGCKGEAYLESKIIPFDAKFLHAFHAFDYSVSRRIGQEILLRFKRKEYKEVIIIGTEFINSLISSPRVNKLFPLDLEDGIQTEEMIEPTPAKVFNELLPQYMNSTIYSILLNSLVSEFSSRRNAMESASDNAKDVIDQLRLDYNKARQAAITQEITEVVSGANALK